MKPPDTPLVPDAEDPLDAAQRLARAMLAMVPVANAARRFDDAETLRQAAQLLWPECPWVETYEGLNLVMAGLQAEALQWCRARTDSAALAVQAGCLLYMQDPAWVAMAHEVIHRNDCEPSSRSVRKLLSLEGFPIPDEETLAPISTVFTSMHHSLRA